MNWWKIGFWVSLVLLIAVTLGSFYAITDQAVTMTYNRVSYDDLQVTVDDLLAIINSAELSKGEIEEVLKATGNFEHYNFETDTFNFDRISIVFQNDSLVEAVRMW